jgi:16S rRNA (cytidine1402-2'-O)-methyltransferase
LAPADAGGRPKDNQPSREGGGRKPDRRGEGRQGTLYLVATPIGNLRDVSLRALDTLARADAIACEDTRVTAKLLARHGIAKPLIAYHDHNAERVRPLLLARLGQGEAIALVSDAGSPLVSDPGFKLVREAVARGLAVTTVPGPSAAVAALQLSGLPADRFFFAGFLPPKTAARRKTLLELKAVPGTLIFFETAPRLARALADMAEVLGPRPAAVARELTKMFEEVRRDALPALARHYAEAGPPKGEIAIVVARASESSRASNDMDVDRALEDSLARLSPSAAAAEAARLTGVSRRELYRRALELKKR